MKFGVCYYPEQWPEEQWAADARLMREVGLDMVRIAEFAWAKMEPADGVFAWDWLDRAIDTLADAGLQIVLGTPTATPPAWLTRSQPQILRVDGNGRARNHGSRRHTCPNSPVNQQYSQRMVAEMVARYGRDPRIIGWQIDNEFGGGKTGRCYCPECAAAFREWLHKRYEHIDTLNEAWGTIFWSQTYSDWAEIEPPDDSVDKKNPSHLLDYFRFSSDSIVAYQQRQVDLIRAHASGQFVTHNFMGLYLDLNQFDLAGPLDFATWDNYPTGNPERWRKFLLPPDQNGRQPADRYAYDVGDPIITAMAHDLMRGLKQQPFWIMEQQCGHINWGDVNPGIRPGTTRLWCWHALAAGADTILFFRWRAALMAHEQYHSGLLRHDGTTAVGFHDLRTMQTERELMAQIAAEPYQAEVALLFSYDDLWALQEQPHRTDFGYLRLAFVYYQALQQLGIPVDIVPPNADLSRYKLVIAATAHIVTDTMAVTWASYVAAGGWLLVGIRSGFKTASNRVTDQPLPGLLHHLVGATVEDWQSLPERVGWPLTTTIPGLHGPATTWVETLQPHSARPLASYEDGMAALTENEVGDGRVLYNGFYPTTAQATAVLNYLAHQTNIVPIAKLPPGMLAARHGRYTILLNFTDQPLTAVVGPESATPESVTVAARGTAVTG